MLNVAFCRAPKGVYEGSVELGGAANTNEVWVPSFQLLVTDWRCPAESKQFTKASVVPGVGELAHGDDHEVCVGFGVIPSVEEVRLPARS